MIHSAVATAPDGRSASSLSKMTRPVSSVHDLVEELLAVDRIGGRLDVADDLFVGLCRRVRGVPPRPGAFAPGRGRSCVTLNRFASSRRSAI